MSDAATTPPAKKARKQQVYRPSSPSSLHHMSAGAVDVSVSTYASMTDLQCVRHLAKARWGCFKVVTCPHCNSSATHYWSTKELRWKCKGCGKRFSVTSNTVFANRRMPLQTLWAAVHLWVCGASGKPALEVRRILSMKGYNTAFTLLTKAREAIARGYNIGFISGVIEMDGAHTSGRRASEKRGIPLGQRLIDESEALDDATLTQAARQKKKRDAKAKALAEGGVLDPAYGNVLPPLRRITLNARMRGGASGKGALQTRSAICLAESPSAAEELARRFVAIPESILATDTGNAFSKLGKRFMGHVQVNHSQHLVGPGGEHSNNSESFTARMDRAEKGIYLNLEPKYLHEYAVETAFREDHNRMPPGAITQRLMHYATNVGLSRDFRGYTHGRHRNHEVLLTGNQWATSSGPAKGRSPISSVNGRPPR
jgi:transposase-like protein